MRAAIDKALQRRLVEWIMQRDQLTEDQAARVLDELQIADLVRLEMETRDHEQPAFTADYDPYARD
jgi:hypothetical protein